MTSTEKDLKAQCLAHLLRLRRCLQAELTSDPAAQEAYRHLEDTIAYVCKPKKDLVAIQYELSRLSGCIARLSLGGYRFKTETSQQAWMAFSDFFSGPSLKDYRPDKVLICLD